jgi:hypothetical protein
MALENQKASYEVQITRTGDGAALGIQDFKNLDSAAASANETLTSTSGSLTKLRESSMLAREGMNGLNSAMVLAGGTRFTGLTEGVMVARDAFMGLRTAAMLTGESMLAVSGPLAAVVALVAVSVTEWKAHEMAIQANQTALNRLVATGNLWADVNKRAWQYSAEGLMTAEQRKEAFSAPTAQTANLRMNNMGFTAEQVAQFDKFQTLERQFYEETLGQYDKERAKAEDNYQRQLAQINDLAAKSRLITPEQTAQASGNVAAGYMNSMRAIQDKEDAAAAKAEAALDKQDAEAKIQLQKLVTADQRAELAEQKADEQAFHEESLGMVKDFNQQEKLYSLTSKEDKKTILATELQDRKDFDLEMYADYRMTLEQMQQADMQAQIKYQEGLNAIEKSEKLHVLTVGQMEAQAANNFASGFSSAFVSFVNGTKSAQQAFAEFAQSFLSSIAEMILQQEVLSVIKSAFFSGGGTAVSGGSGDAGGELKMAYGGMIMAAGGISGIGSLSTPTYFPKFNVVAGEAGTEALTVLARPRMMDIGGMRAVVGQAGNQTLAITSAAALAGGAGGVSGTAVIMIQPSPGYEASIVSNAIQGAVLKVTSDMGQNTALRQAAKQAVS